MEGNQRGVNEGMKLIIFFVTCSLLYGGGRYVLSTHKPRPMDVVHVAGEKEKVVPKIEAYLRRKGSPLVGYSGEFYKASSYYRIPVHIILGICASESSLGKHYQLHTNNVFGWGYCDSCKSGLHFSSIGQGIHHVARSLATRPQFKKFQETKDVKDLSLVYLTGDRERWVSVINSVKEEL